MCMNALVTFDISISVALFELHNVYTLEKLIFKNEAMK